MNKRKQHVIKHAHKLFIEKGYQSTSIQDILEYSGISKGTFYNYFSSKSELLLAVFKMIHEKLRKERNELLIGQNPSDISIFIKQLELEMRFNKQNKLFSLFEEVYVSNDAELKQYIQRFRLINTHWIYLRFVDLFGQDNKPYLLDSTIIFSGILHSMIRNNFMEANASNSVSVSEIIQYCVNRIITIVENVSKSGEQIFPPECLNTWLPVRDENEHDLKNELLHAALLLKNTINKKINEEYEQTMYYEYLEFIEDELLQTRKPRKFLIQSTFASFKATSHHEIIQDIISYEKMAEDYLQQLETTLD